MKKSVKDMIAQTDNAKKVNPRDLSSDQDLTIGLMNLIAIENIAGDSQIAQMVGDVRKKLMRRVVTDDAKYDASLDLLGKSVMLMSDGMRAFPDNRKAYELFDAAYEAYAMFWGLNMGFIKISDLDK
ncbi:MAG: hypothetical protein IJO18_03875 [Alphaproteobacteria bacterium]|nr:hypothetical protein [Alphaproteobacteria bacterium]